MVRDVHSAIEDFKKWRQLGLELELEFPELGIFKAVEELSNKFNSLIMDVHVDQERKYIHDALKVISK